MKCPHVYSLYTLHTTYAHAENLIFMIREKLLHANGERKRERAAETTKIRNSLRFECVFSVINLWP